MSKPISKAAPEEPRYGQYRHQFFQTQSIVEVSILAKKLTAERVAVAYEKKRLHVTIKDAQGEQEYEMDIELYDEVRCTALHAAPSEICCLACAHGVRCKITCSKCIW